MAETLMEQRARIEQALEGVSGIAKVQARADDRYEGVVVIIDAPTISKHQRELAFTYDTWLDTTPSEIRWHAQVMLSRIRGILEGKGRRYA